MFKKFISLEWKQFLRSANFQKSLIVKIFMGIAVLYFILMALGLGIGLYFGLEDSFPDKDPWQIVNNFIVFWFFGEIVMRYMLQKMPVLTIKPLLLMPIKKKSVIHYGLGKSLISIFNVIPFFILMPFSAILLSKGYPTINVVSWFFGILFLSYTLNFITFLINKSDLLFYSILSVLLVIVGLEYFEIFKISAIAGKAFNYLSTNASVIILVLITLVVSYFTSFKFLEKNLNLETISVKKKDIKTTDLSWLNRFGEVAPFLKNDLKLIWRNVRPKKTVLSGFVFLFYALIFIHSKEGFNSSPYMLAFAMMFVTGGFAMTFGQLVPSWDSEYYQLLMSQNIKYKTYLDSKWYLMTVAVVISFILATPYIYFGWKVYSLLIAGLFFNAGINSYLVLLGGVLNRMPIKLNEKAKAFGNTQGFKMTQMLIALPKMLLPIALFGIPYKFINHNAGILTVIGFSIVGILLKNYFLTRIEKIYQKTKYKTIAAYNESN